MIPQIFIRYTLWCKLSTETQGSRDTQAFRHYRGTDICMLKVIDTFRHTRTCRSKQAHFHKHTIHKYSLFTQASIMWVLHILSQTLFNNLLPLLYRLTDSHTYLGYDTWIHVPITQVFSRHARSFLTCDKYIEYSTYSHLPRTPEIQNTPFTCTTNSLCIFVSY